MRQRARLLRYLERGLPERERRRLEAALAGSPRLRRERAELARGLAAAESLRGTQELSETRAAAIEAALRAAAAAGPRRARERSGLALAAAVLVGLGAALLLAAWDPGLRLEPGPADPSPLEAAALGLHERLEEGRLELDLATDSPRAARRFVRSAAGLDASLVEHGSPGRAERFELQGVAVTAVAGTPAAGVAYRIGGVPTLLLTVRAGAVSGAPADWGPLGRTLRHRSVGSRRVLSWTNAGQSYVLVSRLPGHGQESCSICHAGSERSRLVERAAESL